MDKELQELVDNRFEMKKEAIIECEEISKIAEEFNQIIKEAELKLAEFSKAVLKNTGIYIEKNRNNDEIQHVRVPINVVLSDMIFELSNLRHEIWQEIENKIIEQYQNRGFPVVKRGGAFKTRISKSASRTINYRFEVWPVELQGVHSQRRHENGTHYMTENTGIRTDKLIIRVDNGLKKSITEEIIKNFK